MTPPSFISASAKDAVSDAMFLVNAGCTLVIAIVLWRAAVGLARPSVQSLSVRHIVAVLRAWVRAELDSGSSAMVSWAVFFTCWTIDFSGNLIGGPSSTETGVRGVQSELWGLCTTWLFVGTLLGLSATLRRYAGTRTRSVHRAAMAVAIAASVLARVGLVYLSWSGVAQPEWASALRALGRAAPFIALVLLATAIYTIESRRHDRSRVLAWAPAAYAGLQILPMIEYVIQALSARKWEYTLIPAYLLCALLFKVGIATFCVRLAERERHQRSVDALNLGILTVSLPSVHGTRAIDLAEILDKGRVLHRNAWIDRELMVPSRSGDFALRDIAATEGPVHASRMAGVVALRKRDGGAGMFGLSVSPTYQTGPEADLVTLTIASPDSAGPSALVLGGVHDPSKKAPDFDRRLNQFLHSLPETLSQSREARLLQIQWWRINRGLRQLDLIASAAARGKTDLVSFSPAKVMCGLLRDLTNLSPAEARFVFDLPPERAEALLTTSFSVRDSRGQHGTAEVIGDPDALEAIVEGSLHNAARHGCSTDALPRIDCELQVHHDGATVLEISNGFELSGELGKPYGLWGLQAIAVTAGWTLSSEAVSGHTWRVRIKLGNAVVSRS